MDKKVIKKICFTGICVALAIVLDFVCHLIPFFKMPQGGTLSLLALPLIILGAIYGPKWSLFGGFILCLISYLYTDIYPVTINASTAIIQHVLEYWLVNIFLSLSGVLFYYNKDKKKTTQLLYLFIGCFVAFLLKYIIHVLCGVLWWSETGINAAAWIFSLTYNSMYNLLSFVGCFLLAIILLKVLPKKYFTE